MLGRKENRNNRMGNESFRRPVWLLHTNFIKYLKVRAKLKREVEIYTHNEIVLKRIFPDPKSWLLLYGCSPLFFNGVRNNERRQEIPVLRYFMYNIRFIFLAVASSSVAF